MKFKTFRDQFKECCQNGTSVLMDTQAPEVHIPRPNSKGIKSITITEVFFCNKYLQRCSSKVCLQERKDLCPRRSKY